MKENVVESYKRLVRAYTTYQPETGWKLMPNLAERFKLVVVDSAVTAHTKIDILEALDIKWDFSETYGRYAIEGMLSSIATKLGCYDEEIFGSIRSYDCCTAQMEVIERW
jgi:hypothetical protein